MLTEVQNAKQGLLDVRQATVRLVDSNGTTVPLRISGDGRNLNGGKDAIGDNEVVLYGTPGTVAALSGEAATRHSPSGSTTSGRQRSTATVTRLRRLASSGFTALPEMPVCARRRLARQVTTSRRSPNFFSVITVLALLSALVLIANTMATLVAEQTGEIGTMKAIGGRRRQIAMVYVKTAMLLGAVGTVAGLALGIVLSNLLVRYLGSTFFAIDIGFGVDSTIVAISVLVGVLGPALAALPAIRRATRVPLREALEASGSAVGRLDARDRLLRRIRFLPRTAQIGVRNAGRRRRRSLATDGDHRARRRQPARDRRARSRRRREDARRVEDHGEDVKITSESGRRSTRAPQRIIRTTPGVAAVEPMFVREMRLARQGRLRLGVQPRTMFHYHLADGRWYTPAEERAKARVAVVERNIARATGAHVGDRVTRRHARRARSPARDRDRREPAGERDGDLHAARDGAAALPGPTTPTLLGAIHVTRPRVRRPHDDRDRGRPHGERLRSAARSSTSPRPTTSHRTGRSPRRSPCSGSSSSRSAWSGSRTQSP